MQVYTGVKFLDLCEPEDEMGWHAKLLPEWSGWLSCGIITLSLTFTWGALSSRAVSFIVLPRI